MWEGEKSFVVSLARDITERKRAEQAAGQRAAVPDVRGPRRRRVLPARRSGPRAGREPRACESLGYTRDELIGMTPFDFDPDITTALVEDGARKLIAGETITFESRHRRKDGTTFPVELRGKAFWEGGR